jgi:hypothetical protein
MSDYRGTLSNVNTRTLNGYEHLTTLIDAIAPSPTNREWKDRARGLSALLEIEGVFDGLDEQGQQDAARHVAGCLVHANDSDGFRERAGYLRSQDDADSGRSRQMASAVQRAGNVVALF